MRRTLALLLSLTLLASEVDASLLSQENPEIISSVFDAIVPVEEAAASPVDAIEEEIEEEEAASNGDCAKNESPVDAENEPVEVDLSDYVLNEGGLKSIDELDDIEDINMEIYGNSEGEGLPVNNASAAETALLNAYKNFQDSVDLSSYNLSPSAVSTLVTQVLNSNPRLFYAKGGFSYSYSGGAVLTVFLSYSYSIDEAKAMMVAYDGAVDDFCENIDPTWCDLEKIIYANTWITQRCEYERTISKANIYNAYGVLVNREAVCQGYATAMIELCNQLGMEAALVTSYNVNHAWNLVKINGKLYHIDTTWNDPIGGCENHWSLHDYFLCSTEQFTNPQAYCGVGIRSHVNGTNDWKISVRNWKYQDAKDTTYDNPEAFAFGDQYMAKGIHPGDNHTWYATTYKSDEHTNVLVAIKCDCGAKTFKKTSEIKDFGIYYYNTEKRSYLSTNSTNMAAISNYTFLGFWDGIYRLNRTTGQVQAYYMLTDEELAKGLIYDMYILDNILYYGLDTKYGNEGHVELKSIDVTKGSYINDSFKVTVNPNNGEENFDIYVKYGKKFTEAFDASGNGKPLTNPTKQYYKFKGWTYNSDGSGRILETSAKFKKIEDCNLYAAYTPIYYTATLNFNGGVIVSGNTTIKSKTIKNIVGDQKIFLDTSTNTVSVPAPTKTGYTFDGWYTANEGGNKVDGTSTMQSLSLVTNFVLYARFSPVESTVTLDKVAEGASLSKTSFKVKYGETYGDLPTPVYDGFTFNGWFTDPTSGTKVVSTTKVSILENQTLYARWTENTYTLKLHSNSDKDKVLATYKLNYTDEKVLDELSTYNLTNTLGTLTGKWNTKADGSGNEIADGATIKSLSKTNGGTVDLYAQWSLPSYTIKFLSGDESASEGLVTNGYESVYNYNDSLVLSGKEFVKNGYAITGWKLESTKESEPKTKSATLKNASYTKLSKIDGESFNLTANWAKNTYKVTYNLNGGAYVKGATKGTASYTIDNEVESLVLPEAAVLTKKGYTFAGWYENKELSGSPVTSLVITNDTPVKRTLFAKWNPISYTIKLDANGGVAGTKALDATTVVAYDEVYELTKDDFVRAGYTLTGYKAEIQGKAKNFKFTKVKSLTDTANETITLVAQWKPNTYTIKYVMDGGKNNGGKAKYTSGAGLTIKNPTKKGYEFRGWTLTMKDGSEVKTATIAKDEDGTTYSLSTASYGDILLTAKWLPISYKVNLYINRTEGIATNITTHDKFELVVPYDDKEDPENLFKYAGFFESYLDTSASATESITAFNTKADGKGKKYAVNQDIINWTATEGEVIDLYAIWGPKTYRIDYDLNGGSISKQPVTFKAGTVPKIPTPTKTGYYFDKWESPITKDTAENVTLKALWKANEFTVKLNPNAKDAKKSAVATSLKVTYNPENAKYITNPYSRTGYLFEGYNTKANGKGDMITDLATLPTKNKGTITLYAIWQAEAYTISYLNMVSTDTNKNPIVAYYGKSIKLSSPAREGYTFLGFTMTTNSNDQNVTIKAKTNYVASINATNRANITLKANWVENSYTLKISSNSGVNALTNKAETVVYELEEDGRRTTLIPYTKSISISDFNTRFAKKGYVFKGFSTDKKGKNMVGSSLSKLSVKNKAVVTLYAIWDKVNVVVPTVTGSSSASGKLELSIAGNPNNGEPLYKIYYTKASDGLSFRNATLVESASTTKTITGLTAGRYYVKVIETKKDSFGNILESKASQIIAVDVN